MKTSYPVYLVAKAIFNIGLLFNFFATGSAGSTFRNGEALSACYTCRFSFGCYAPTLRKTLK
jgi:hypothetical protein